MEDEKHLLSDKPVDEEGAAKQATEKKRFCAFLSLILVMCAFYAAADLCIGIWLALSLQSLSAGILDGYSGNLTAAEAADLKDLVDSNILILTAGSFALVAFVLTASLTICFNNLVVKVVGIVTGVTVILLNIGSGICACLFLIYLNRSSSIWQMWQVQFVTARAVAVIVVTFGLLLVAAIASTFCILCNFGCIFTKKK